MYVYIYTYVYTCAYIYIYIYLYVYMCMYMSVCVNFVPRQLLITWGFPALYLGIPIDATQTCHAVNSLRQ